MRRSETLYKVGIWDHTFVPGGQASIFNTLYVCTSSADAEKLKQISGPRAVIITTIHTAKSQPHKNA